jgi:nuclear pore complex protein Nup133
MRSETDVQVSKSKLSSNDVFYKDVSRIHQIIPALISIQEELFNDLTTKEIPERILQTNEIILRAKLEISQSQWGEKLGQIHDLLIRPVMMTEENQYEVLPWLVQRTVLPSFLKQHEIIINSGIKNSDVDPGLKVDLIKHLQQYTDLILSELKLNLESIDGTDRYEQKLRKFEDLRGKLLREHLEVGDYDGARLLAEKFLDFEILVTICYNQKDFEALELYFSKYEDMNFPEYTFDWYIKQTKTAELVETFSSSRFTHKLKNFLRQYPQVAWHYSAVTEDFTDASEQLLKLAEEDKAYAVDKNFYLCMAMLSSLASEPRYAELKDVMKVSGVVKHVEHNLELLKFQDMLPDDVLAAVALERDSMRVLTPEEMIDMYTTDDVEFEVENYWNAFRLSSYMVNSELEREKR